MLLDKAETGYGFEDLVTIVEVLRSNEGCPWDKEQTHKSIRRDFIEETYEVIEAIDTDNRELLREELGDVMLQVVFHAQIETENECFTIEDVANDICVKLIHRHPHVFADVQADTSEKVLSNWEKIKSEEKERKTVTDKLRAIPPMLPALMRAEKVGKKASCFDFPDTDSVMEKVYEELDELKDAMTNGSKDNVAEEMGDLLLTVTSLCRKLGVESEVALSRATDKFIDRFENVEKAVLKSGKNMGDLSLDELDAIWDENKQK
ncbi:MAG: nucleoside triphosphate pyrophosphohydrolase [Clostridia bacterium]|nr:nucleoside triphosphate pyrophosphohydrolase [Clostridia bacterium]